MGDWICATRNSGLEMMDGEKKTKPNPNLLLLLKLIVK